MTNFLEQAPPTSVGKQNFLESPVPVEVAPIPEPKGEASSYEALDVLEATDLKQKQHREAGGDPVAPEDIDAGVNENLVAIEQDGVDSREVNYWTFDDEQELERTAAFDEAMLQFENPELPMDKKVELIKAVQNMPQFDSFIKDPDAAVMSLLQRNMKRKILNFTKNPEAITFSPEEESHIWNMFVKAESEQHMQPTDMLSHMQWALKRPEIMAIHDRLSKGQINSEDKEAFAEGFVDSLMRSWMFLPEWVHGMVDSDVAEEMQQYDELMAAKSDKMGIMYKTGSVGGEGLGMFADPILDTTGLAAPVLIGLKRAASLMKTSKRVGDVIGRNAVVALSQVQTKDQISVFGKLKEESPERWAKFVEASKGENSLSAHYKEIIKQVEAGNYTLPKGPLKANQSAIANLAQNSVMYKQTDREKILQSVLKAAEGPGNNPAQFKALQKALGTGEYVKFSLLPDVPLSGVAHPGTDMGTILNNATMISQVSGKMSERFLMNSAAEELISANRIYTEPRVVDLGVQSWGGSFGKPNVKNRFLSFSFSPRDTIKGPGKKALVEQTILNDLTEKRIIETLNQNLESIFKPLSKSEMGDLEALIQTGNDLDRRWTATSGGVYMRGVKDSFRPVSEKVKDSLRAYNMQMNDAAVSVNKVLRETARTQGHKYIPQFESIAYRQKTIKGEPMVSTLDGELVKWDKTRRNAGDTLWSVRHQTGNGYEDKLYILSPDEVEGQLFTISDSHDFMKPRQQYMHVQYTDDYIVTRVQVNPKTGEFLFTEQVATAKSMKEAGEFTKKFANAEKGTFYIADRMVGGSADIVGNPALFDNMVNMDEKKMGEMLQMFKDAGKSEDFLEALKANYERYGISRQSFTKERGERLVSAHTATQETRRSGPGKVQTKIVGESAPILPLKESSRIYMQKVARLTAHAPTNEKLVQQFSEEYKRFLVDPEDPFGPLKDIGDKTGIKEARLFQRQLKNLTSRKQLTDVVADAWLQAAKDKLEFSKHPTISEAGRVLNKVAPNLAGVMGPVKSMTRQTLMGVMATVQLALQFGTGYIHALGIEGLAPLMKLNPKQSAVVMSKAHADFVGLLVPSVTKGRTAMTKESMRVWNLMRKSGIAAGIDLDTFSSLARDPRNMRELTTGWMGKSTKTVGNIVSGWAVAGEKGAQVFAWLSANREMEYLIKKGKHPSLTMKDLSAGNQKYIDAVTLRSTRIAHNMSKANRAGMSSGDILSTVTQLKRFMFDEAGLYYNMGEDISKTEMFALWATTIGLFGYRGMPGIEDAMVAAELAANSLPGVPDKAGSIEVELSLAFIEQSQKLSEKLGIDIDDKTLKLALTQGLPAAMTEGQVQLASRMAVGSIYTSFLQGASMDEMALGAAWTTTKRLLKAGTISAEVLVNALREDGLGGFNEETVGVILDEASSPFVGIEKLKQAYTANETGEVRAKQGALLVDGASFEDILMLTAGVTPGKISALQEYNAVLWKRKADIKDWLKGAAQQISKLSVEGNNDTADLMMDSVAKQLEDAGYELASVSFLQTVMNETMKKEMPIELRTELDIIGDAFVEDNLRTILGLIK